MCDYTVSGKGIDAEMSRSCWVCDDLWKIILATMMPANALAIEVSLTTGLRISDVLSLKTEKVAKTNRPYVVDSKTGKHHRILIPKELRARLLSQAGKIWVFEGRLDVTKHRTRWTVYKDMQNAVRLLRRNGRIGGGTVSPHSARKSAAVHAYDQGGLDAAARLLVHDRDHPSVTLLYALSDETSPSSRRRSKRS